MNTTGYVYLVGEDGGRVSRRAAVTFRLDNWTLKSPWVTLVADIAAAHGFIGEGPYGEVIAHEKTGFVIERGSSLCGTYELNLDGLFRDKPAAGKKRRWLGR